LLYTIEHLSSTNQSRSNRNAQSQWNQNLRLYPSLKDALSPKPHPLNLVNIPENERKRQMIGFEQVNQTVSKENVLSMSRSHTFDETLSKQENIESQQASYDLSKQRFKRRGRNRPSSPLPQAVYETNLSTNIETNPNSTLNRKKKRIPVSQTIQTSTSSSVSSDDERQREFKQKERIRFRRSQEIQRQLDELEEKRFDLDKRHSLARQHLSKSHKRQQQ